MYVQPFKDCTVMGVGVALTVALDEVEVPIDEIDVDVNVPDVLGEPVDVLVTVVVVTLNV